LRRINPTADKALVIMACGGRQPGEPGETASGTGFITVHAHTADMGDPILDHKAPESEPPITVKPMIS
jgi:hypothetical protein